MYGFAALTVAIQLLVLNANAQTNTCNSRPSCSDPKVDLVTRWNSTTSRVMTAVKLIGERPDDGCAHEFYLQSDSAREWKLTLRAQSMLEGDAEPGSSHASYRQTLFLDTADSNMTDIGSCHQIIGGGARPFQFRWTKEALERSMDVDERNCTSILGDECIEAMKRNTAIQAVKEPFRTGSCEAMNKTLPAECSFLGPSEVQRTEQMNLIHLDNISFGWPNSEFDPAMRCQGINMSSTHSLPMVEWMKDYDNAVRMPVIDIITFWPNSTSGTGIDFGGYESAVHVELVCMRPDATMAQGSVIPPSGSEMLNDDQAMFDYQSESRALALNPSIFGWMAVVFMSLLLVV